MPSLFFDSQGPENLLFKIKYSYKVAVRVGDVEQAASHPDVAWLKQAERIAGRVVCIAHCFHFWLACQR
jgi:hypothetical protein